jgi:hypothetical protein
VNPNCAAFERWLDEGLATAGAAGARTHAAACARCAALLELEEALLEPAHVLAPADFSDAVMRRVHAEPVRGRSLVPTGWATPLWVQAMLDPLVALTGTAILLTWFGRDALLGLGGSLASRWGAAQWPAIAWPTLAWPAFHLPGTAGLRGVSQVLASVAADPVVLTALLMAIAPAVLLASWQLFRWTEHWAGRVASPGALRHAGAHAVAR